MIVHATPARLPVSAARALFLALAFLAAAAGCGGGGGGNAPPPFTAESGERVRALCTTTLVGDLVQQVGGENVEVRVLFGPGVDPHHARASRGAGRLLKDADLVFHVGRGLERGIAGEMAKLDREGKGIGLADSVHTGYLIPDPDAGPGMFDPHVWFMPGMWRIAAEAAQHALTSVDPENASRYKERTAALIDSLIGLDRWADSLSFSLPRGQLVFASAHHGLRYLASGYHLESLALEPAVPRSPTEGEPDAGRARAFADTLVERGVRTIFAESTLPRERLEPVRAQAAARGVDLEIAGPLYVDQLSEADGPAPTWQRMFRYDMEALMKAMEKVEAP